MKKPASITGSTWPVLLFALIVLGVGLWAMVAHATDVSAGAITALTTAVLGVAGTHVGHVAGHELATRHLSAERVADGVEWLAGLREKGPMSDDEFAAAKRKLIELLR